MQIASASAAFEHSEASSYSPTWDAAAEMNAAASAALINNIEISAKRRDFLLRRKSKTLMRSSVFGVWSLEFGCCFELRTPNSKLQTLDRHSDVLNDLGQHGVGLFAATQTA